MINVIIFKKHVVLFGKGPYIYDDYPKRGWRWGSWNLLHVCWFYCFKTINLLFIFEDWKDGGHKIGHFFVDVINVWPLKIIRKYLKGTILSLKSLIAIFLAVIHVKNLMILNEKKKMQRRNSFYNPVNSPLLQGDFLCKKLLTWNYEKIISNLVLIEVLFTDTTLLNNTKFRNSAVDKRWIWET